jgi:hypothetical protein
VTAITDERVRFVLPIRDKSRGGRELNCTNSVSGRVRKILTRNVYQSISDFMLNITRIWYLDGNAYALALTMTLALHCRLASPWGSGHVLTKLGFLVFSQLRLLPLLFARTSNRPRDRARDFSLVGVLSPSVGGAFSSANLG